MGGWSVDTGGTGIRTIVRAAFGSTVGGLTTGRTNGYCDSLCIRMSTRDNRLLVCSRRSILIRGAVVFS